MPPSGSVAGWHPCCCKGCEFLFDDFESEEASRALWTHIDESEEMIWENGFLKIHQSGNLRYNDVANPARLNDSGVLMRASFVVTRKEYYLIQLLPSPSVYAAAWINNYNDYPCGELRLFFDGQLHIRNIPSQLLDLDSIVHLTLCVRRKEEETGYGIKTTWIAEARIVAGGGNLNILKKTDSGSVEPSQAFNVTVETSTSDDDIYAELDSVSMEHIGDKEWFVVNGTVYSRPKRCPGCDDKDKKRCLILFEGFDTDDNTPIMLNSSNRSDPCRVSSERNGEWEISNSSATPKGSGPWTLNIPYKHNTFIPPLIEYPFKATLTAGLREFKEDIEFKWNIADIITLSIKTLNESCSEPGRYYMQVKAGDSSRIVVVENPSFSMVACFHEDHRDVKIASNTWRLPGGFLGDTELKSTIDVDGDNAADNLVIHDVAFEYLYKPPEEESEESEGSSQPEELPDQERDDDDKSAKFLRYCPPCNINPTCAGYHEPNTYIAPYDEYPVELPSDQAFKCRWRASSSRFFFDSLSDPVLRFEISPNGSASLEIPALPDEQNITVQDSYAFIFPFVYPPENCTYKVTVAGITVTVNRRSATAAELTLSGSGINNGPICLPISSIHGVPDKIGLFFFGDFSELMVSVDGYKFSIPDFEVPETSVVQFEFEFENGSDSIWSDYLGPVSGYEIYDEPHKKHCQKIESEENDCVCESDQTPPDGDELDCRWISTDGLTKSVDWLRPTIPGVGGGRWRPIALNISTDKEGNQREDSYVKAYWKFSTRQLSDPHAPTYYGHWAIEIYDIEGSLIERGELKFGPNLEDKYISLGSEKRYIQSPSNELYICFRDGLVSFTDGYNIITKIASVDKAASAGIRNLDSDNLVIVDTFTICRHAAGSSCKCRIGGPCITCIDEIPFICKERSSIPPLPSGGRVVDVPEYYIAKVSLSSNLNSGSECYDPCDTQWTCEPVNNTSYVAGDEGIRTRGSCIAYSGRVNHTPRCDGCTALNGTYILKRDTQGMESGHFYSSCEAARTFKRQEADSWQNPLFCNTYDCADPSLGIYRQGTIHCLREFYTRKYIGHSCFNYIGTRNFPPVQTDPEVWLTSCGDYCFTQSSATIIALSYFNVGNSGPQIFTMAQMFISESKLELAFTSASTQRIDCMNDTITLNLKVNMTNPRKPIINPCTCISCPNLAPLPGHFLCSCTPKSGTLVLDPF